MFDSVPNELCVHFLNKCFTCRLYGYVNFILQYAVVPLLFSDNPVVARGDATHVRRTAEAHRRTRGAGGIRDCGRRHSSEAIKALLNGESANAATWHYVVNNHFDQS